MIIVIMLLVEKLSYTHGRTSLTWTDVAYMDVAYKAKFKHSKNAFKTVLARSGAEKNHFMCFDHLYSLWTDFDRNFQSFRFFL